MTTTTESDTSTVIPTQRARKPLKLSNSQRSSWLRCPNQFRLERGGYPVAPSLSLIAGSAFHAGCDIIDWNLWEEADRLTADDITSIWHDCLKVETKDALAKEPDVSKWRVYGRKTKDKPNKEDFAWWYEAGIGLLTQYRDYREVETAGGMDIWELPDGSPAIEVQFEFDITEDVTLRGAIDRIMSFSEGLLIRDLKTSQREPSDVSQLGIYRVAVQETFGITADWGDYYLARQAGTGNPVQLSHFTRDLLAREYGFIATARRLELYPANPGDACRSCGVRAACAAVGGSEAEKWLNVMP